MTDSALGNTPPEPTETPDRLASLEAEVAWLRQNKAYHIEKRRAVEAERDRYAAALVEAADDLDKAANQFAALRKMQGQPWPIIYNPERFAEKAARARAAISS